MKTQTVPINEVKSNPNNPRIIKDDKFKKLVASIKELPQMLELRPIVVNDDMIVLGGNMRLKACKEAGLKEVPVIFADDLGYADLGVHGGHDVPTPHLDALAASGVRCRGRCFGRTHRNA
jgi:ParB-like chromosome segregation protein Spo0J